ncbi:MAG: peptidase signal peptidase [Lachnospiraceae bacterium]|jgi:signal peptidase II|nr:peptidase signal peptidase [Lachnospiraceae bacterium]
MIFVVIILSLFFLDYRIKKYIEEKKEMHKKEEILKGNIIIERYHNKGAILNSLDSKPNLVILISTTVLGLLLIFFAVLLTKKGNTLYKFGLSLILGGALNNVYDRMKRGYVVDYFSFKFLKRVVFNLSDIFIFIGAGIIFIVSLFDKK